MRRFSSIRTVLYGLYLLFCFSGYGLFKADADVDHGGAEAKRRVLVFQAEQPGHFGIREHRVLGFTCQIDDKVLHVPGGHHAAD